MIAWPHAIHQRPVLTPDVYRVSGWAGKFIRPIMTIEAAVAALPGVDNAPVTALPQLQATWTPHLIRVVGTVEYSVTTLVPGNTIKVLALPISRPTRWPAIAFIRAVGTLLKVVAAGRFGDAGAVTLALKLTKPASSSAVLLVGSVQTIVPVVALGLTWDANPIVTLPLVLSASLLW